jgi:DNA-binding response OmpR family regulator
MTGRMRGTSAQTGMCRDAANLYGFFINPGLSSLHFEFYPGRPVHLTPKQFDLLRFLTCCSETRIPQECLLRFLWGNEDHGELEYLRTLMSQIRKKIEDDPANPKYLLTGACVGYRFCEAH